jgi:four helix bundle protein
MHNFKELIVWQKSRALVKEIYLLTKKFPKDETFGLVQQVRRAVVSVASNIAEGSGRGTDADFSHFLDIALGSVYEVETQIILSSDLDYITNDEFESVNQKINEVERLLISFKKTIKK